MKFTCPNPVLLVWASGKWSSVKTAILKALKSMNSFYYKHESFFPNFFKEEKN
jgi:hypothetical protein